jgi:hypothetical protein
MAEAAIFYSQSKSSGVTEDACLITVAPARICRTNGLWKKVEVAVDQVAARKCSKGILMLCETIPYFRNTGGSGKKKKPQGSHET